MPDPTNDDLARAFASLPLGKQAAIGGTLGLNRDDDHVYGGPERAALYVQRAGEAGALEAFRAVVAFETKRQQA